MRSWCKAVAVVLAATGFWSLSSPACAEVTDSINPVLIDATHRLAGRFNTFAAVPNDPRGRVVYGSSRGFLHLLEYTGARYRELWVSSSLISRIQRVIVADLKGDGSYQIVATTTRGGLFVFDIDSYALLSRTQETQFRSIEAITVADVDGDHRAEILFTSEGRLYIYDSVHFVEKWRSDNVYRATDIAAGDVDGDGQADIVLSSGHVLDGVFRNLKWENTAPFGEIIELADVDGDGKLEVVGGSAQATTIWDVDERREKWD
jgi:hypothetical protein